MSSQDDRWLFGPLIVFLASLALESVNRLGWTAGSVAPVLLVVTFSAYVWGLRSGLAGATVMAAYTLYAFGGVGLDFGSPETIRRALWAIVTAYAIAGLMGTMRARERDAMARAQDAERERLEAARSHAKSLAEANAQLVESNRALLKANTTLEAFSYSAAHDLRAPLHAVHALASFTLEEEAERLSEDGKAHLRRMLTSTERMARLLDDLVNLGLVSKRDLTFKPVDVCALARETAAEMRERHPTRSVTFACHDGVEPVHGDEGLLRIVLVNLMENAWKFTSGREGDARVEFGARASGVESTFYVRDNGAGFAPERAVDLFREFTRLHDEREYQGTGIGLATVRRIIERHGGRVWAEGRPGEGAVFYFTLPSAGAVRRLRPDAGAPALPLGSKEG